MSAEQTKLLTERARADSLRRPRVGPAVSSRKHPELYAGIVTRTAAFAIDGAIVGGAAALVGVTVGLGLSVLHLPSQLDAIIAACLGGVALLWSVAYFVFFWSSTGQTPGSRVMSIAVRDSRHRGSLEPRRALVRFLALWLGALAFLMGLLMMLWDRLSRCFQDRVARTIVVYTAKTTSETAAANVEAGMATNGLVGD
jgi:uncharacterized RDD family membrane protein YckC